MHYRPYAFPHLRLPATLKTVISAIIIIIIIIINYISIVIYLSFDKSYFPKVLNRPKI